MAKLLIEVNLRGPILEIFVPISSQIHAPMQYVIIFRIGYFIALFFHNSNDQQKSPSVEFRWEKIEGNLRRANAKLSMDLRRANTNRIWILGRPIQNRQCILGGQIQKPIRNIM